ncbi:protein phosphatase 1 regulatory subunit 12B isoform X3 [Conger conger]|uniref:protein phosphatase 1 regulatory subunit 12B isoform X3 n=1 Tax=Conger conger TaxID=82655 RepID=UPI002A59AEE5|nr:protein phosphatase 1 regulatory subunit 12B isoform X3 [Conger conger]
MQACLPRSYLTPVRDEEAESQRKARSRQARQTRRSTQGVTLAELKEAQRTFSLSPSDRPKPEAQKQRDAVDKRGTEEKGETLTSPTCSRGQQEHSPVWSRDADELGNHRLRLGTQAVSPTTPLTSPSACSSGLLPSRGLTNCSSFRELDQNGNERRTESQTACSPSELNLSLRERRQAQSSIQGASASYWSQEHDRASRLDSGSGLGDSATDRLSGRTSSYTRRENRLASLSKAEDDASSKDFKKMYEDALAENEKLKSRLEDSKQELASIRTQLEKVTQEKRVLEKKVSEMEEELKALPQLAQLQALRWRNERLQAENRAMLRVLARLSDMASLPETEDL